MPSSSNTPAAQIEETTKPLQDIGAKPATAIVGLGYRSVDTEAAPMQVIHRGKFKSLSLKRRAWLKRRQAIEPMIGHTRANHRAGPLLTRGYRGRRAARGAVRPRSSTSLAAAGHCPAARGGFCWP